MATSRPTLRSSCSVPGISNNGAAWSKESTGFSTRPRAKVSVEQIDGRSSTSTPRASLRSPASTQSTAKVRHYGTPSLSSVTNQSGSAGPGIKAFRSEYAAQPVTDGSQVSYTSKASLKASFGNAGPSARTKRTDSTSSAARYVEDPSSDCRRSVVAKGPNSGKTELDRANETYYTRSEVSPASPARSSARKTHLQVEQNTQLPGSTLAERAAALPNLQTTGIPLDIGPNEPSSSEVHVRHRDNLDLSTSTEQSPTSPMSANEDAIVNSAAAEAKRDRKVSSTQLARDLRSPTENLYLQYEDLMITNQSLVTLNRQHEGMTTWRPHGG